MCNICEFGHLHLHTEYSPLDGLGKIREIIQTAKENGHKFIAITDHGTMSGHYEAQKIGEEEGVKVILGCEFYYERENDGKNGHLVVLAKNNTGLRNMYKLHQWASRYNFQRKPRINWEVLKEHHEGLIVTSSCLASTFNQYLMQGDVLHATEWARKFKDVFGDDFYIEIQPNSIPEQLQVNQSAVRIARQLGIEIVATNDVHYVYEQDAFPHEVLLAIQVNRKMDDPKRFKFSTDDFWYKSTEEMFNTFQGLDKEIVIEAMSNTTKIAEKCNARIEKGKYLPRYHSIPEGMTERQLLVRNTMEGAKKRGLSKNREFMQAVQKEIDIIDEEGYSGYFLVVQDYVVSAKERGELVGDGRGSGAGSKVCYLLRITEIPPHEYDLLFERFMAHGREPDIDTDFSDQKAVFRDLQKKYGVENVSRIMTFGKLTAKAVARRVFGVFGHSRMVQGQISDMIGEAKTLKEAYELNPELNNMRMKYPVEFSVMERLEGTISHTGQHAGGTLIYQGLSDLLALTWDSENEIFVAPFDMDTLHELGFYKMDVLGLETLPIIHGAVEEMKKDGIEIDISSIDLEDSEVYDMLCRGDVSGVFQLNNQGAKVVEQQPRNFRDLIAINALIRPGVGDWEEYIARRRGKEWNTHPDRLPYMKETEGIITYQEQFMLDCQTFAGWDLAYADKKVRKNKKIREDENLREQFMKDGLARGYDEMTLQNVWKEIEDAVDGGYSFNKSHSASYAKLSYQTAYLKCKYPLYFYASQMSIEGSDENGQNNIAGFIAECKQRGIRVNPPDINISTERFTVANGAINYRITAIKHVGISAFEHIKELRPIKSFDDFLERRKKQYVKRNVLVNLIKAGCFDFDNPNRAELMWKLDMSERTATQIKNGYECPKYEWNDKIKREWEKEVLGLYLTSHPMERYSFKPITDYPDGGYALQGGEVVEVYAFHPKKDPSRPQMAWVTINTLHGNVKCVVFANTWRRRDVQEAFQVGNIVLVRGKRQGNEILVDSTEKLE